MVTKKSHDENRQHRSLVPLTKEDLSIIKQYKEEKGIRHTTEAIRLMINELAKIKQIKPQKDQKKETKEETTIRNKAALKVNMGFG